MPAIIPSTKKYPPPHVNSGIYSKFMPYMPAIKVRGMNIVAISSTFMPSFILLLMLER